ncbi:MAG: Lrp/AsnC family transcriptional regulator [Candidatus Diapherotrites archaeon]|nr:Lrp/AsnC family transcriptional regulator [Candidatus Diapherotrites archaeon]
MEEEINHIGDVEKINDVEKIDKVDKLDKIDDIDKKILMTLSKNGRSSFSYIADEVGLTDVAVKRRVEKLLDSGIISGIHAKINPKKMGLSYTVVFLVSVEAGKIQQAAIEIAEMKNVVEVFQIMGEKNLLVKIYAKDMDYAKNFADEFGRITGVISYSTNVVLDSFKKSFEFV